jgi:hypothetical protein
VIRVFSPELGGGLFRHKVPLDALFGPDQTGQCAAAQGGINLDEQLGVEFVRVAPQELLPSLNADRTQRSTHDRADVDKRFHFVGCLDHIVPFAFESKWRFLVFLGGDCFLAILPDTMTGTKENHPWRDVKEETGFSYETSKKGQSC